MEEPDEETSSLVWTQLIEPVSMDIFGSLRLRTVSTDSDKDASGPNFNTLAFPTEGPSVVEVISFGAIN